MSPRRLNTNQQNLISLASRQAVANSFQSLYIDISHGEWLHNNAYCQNTATTIENHLRTNSINHCDLCKYIAASAPTHCMDGWGFLGRAVHCLIRGDTDVARHLAYYAELRAAMSILASIGIGVFNYCQIVIDSNNHANGIFDQNNQHNNLGTHVFTWLALEHWAKNQQAASLMGNIIQIDSKPLKDWLNEYLANGSLTSLASYWLSNWGIDLNVLFNDRESRNKVSYSPSHIITTLKATALDSGTFISELWEIFNPYESTRFNFLDKYLLRKSLLKIDTYAPLINKNGIQIQYNDRIEIMLNKMFTNNSILSIWKNFFVSNNFPDPLLLTESEQRRPCHDPRHHFEVLARAALLLRIATGSCFQLIQGATFSSSDLEFWWNNLGIERGFWNKRNKPGHNNGDMLSLWDEIDDAIQRIQSWKIRVNQPTYMGLIKKQNSSLRILESCEKIGLWGMIP